MKRCRVQPHSIDGTMDCRGNTVGEHDSAHLSQPPFGVEQATSPRGEPASPHASFHYEMWVEELEPRHHVNARKCGVRKEYSAEGFD